MGTWNNSPETPFGSNIDRIPLGSAPLVGVVAQVRFAPVLSVRDQGFIAPFQEAIRQSLPLVQKRVEQQVAPGVDGSLQLAESVLWRFSDIDDNWHLTLSESFVSLECTKYTNREEYLNRLREALSAVGDHVKPVLTSRVGMRYADRIEGTDVLDRLPEFVRPELLGLASTQLGSGAVISEFTQAEFVTEGVTLNGRWGHMPPNATHDPHIEALDKPSWILDLDASTALTTPFDPVECAKEIERFTGIVYSFFRWAVSDEFLTAYGAAL